MRASILFVLLIGATCCEALLGGRAKGMFKRAIGKRSVGQKTLVADFMAKDIVALQESSSLQDAAQLIVEKKIRGAPVVDESGKLVGVLSQCNVPPRSSLARGTGRADAVRSALACISQSIFCTRRPVGVRPGLAPVRGASASRRIPRAGTKSRRRP